jgi:peptidoglycan/xylan/chitin deacetylase (PgdA/CDA1 family)
MRKTIVSTIDYFDRLIAHSLVSLSIERNAIITLLFHGIVENENELNSDLIKPDYVTTTTCLRNTVDYYLSSGYVFISSDDMIQGLDDHKKYILLTFDDGYFNNNLALPILEEFNVPATFFISSNFIEKNVGFWWDVIYRERIRRKKSLQEIEKEMVALERVKPDNIKKYMMRNFGTKALAPACDIDRPFTFEELKHFANHRLVTLGNHTSNHAVLTVLDRQEVTKEIKSCRDFLAQIDENPCPVISYPMGYYSDEIAKISKELGFVFGFTVNEQKNYFPLGQNGIAPLLLNRFTPLRSKNWQRQLIDYRTDYHIKKMIKKTMFKR